MSASSELYETVTRSIADELERGTVPWIKPWKVGAENGVLPCNAVSRKAYRGVNILLLWMAAAESGYRHPAWLTFRQAKELGGHVKKGERGTHIVYAATYPKTTVNQETGEETKENIPFLKFYTVFNLGQTEGLPERLYRVAEPVPWNEAIEQAEAFLKQIGADVRHGGNRAFYSPAFDRIQLPEPHAFESAGHYYATSFHEHGHWTAHSSRLDRNLSGRFGSEAYAAEELVAEMTAAFLCATLSIPGMLRHAEYIASWIRLLQADKRAIFTAAAKATVAADYLRSLAGHETPAAGQGEEDGHSDLDPEQREEG